MYTHYLYIPRRVSPHSLVGMMPAKWRAAIKTLLSAHETRSLQLAGVGNPIRSDDGVGLYIASKLRTSNTAKSIKGLKILPTNRNPELLFSRLDPRDGDLLIFDAVECNQRPGTIVFAGLDDTKYGFFVTHNVPLRLIPQLRSIRSAVYILGIQPETLEIGEELSRTVKASADSVVETIAGASEEA